jgi:hypothetical protein
MDPLEGLENLSDEQLAALTGTPRESAALAEALKRLAYSREHVVRLLTRERHLLDWARDQGDAADVTNELLDDAVELLKVKRRWDAALEMTALRDRAASRRASLSYVAAYLQDTSVVQLDYGHNFTRHRGDQSTFPVGGENDAASAASAATSVAGRGYSVESDFDAQRRCTLTAFHLQMGLLRSGL